MMAANPQAQRSEAVGKAIEDARVFLSPAILSCKQDERIRTKLLRAKPIF
jgi:hypothetical protein